MPRIRPLEKHEAPWLARPVYWLSRKSFGKAITPLKVMARRPSVLWLVGLLGSAIEKPVSIHPRLQALAKLRSAQVIGCPF